MLLDLFKSGVASRIVHMLIEPQGLLSHEGMELAPFIDAEEGLEKMGEGEEEEESKP